ncbi:nuclear transport factor 2 family protein [Nocardioides pacificus]
MDDHEAIRQLKYRYVRFLDTKAWDDYTETFAPEATADYAGLVFDGRDAIVDYMRTNMTADMITLHQVHHPEITVDGDTATGTWYLQDKVIVPAFKFVLEGAAFYDDRYVRTSDGWRIAHTGYRRTYEMTWSTDDLASVKIKQNPTH